LASSWFPSSLSSSFQSRPFFWSVLFQLCLPLTCFLLIGPPRFVFPSHPSATLLFPSVFVSSYVRPSTIGATFLFLGDSFCCFWRFQSSPRSPPSSRNFGPPSDLRPSPPLSSPPLSPSYLRRAPLPSHPRAFPTPPRPLRTTSYGGFTIAQSAVQPSCFFLWTAVVIRSDDWDDVVLFLDRPCSRIDPPTDPNT